MSGLGSLMFEGPGAGFPVSFVGAPIMRTTVQ